MLSYQALNGRRFLCLPAHKDASPSQPSLWVPWFSSSEAVKLQPQSFVSRGKGFGEARCLPPPSCRAAPCRTTAPSMPRGRQVRRGRPTAPQDYSPQRASRPEPPQDGGAQGWLGPGLGFGLGQRRRGGGAVPGGGLGLRQAGGGGSGAAGR